MHLLRFRFFVRILCALAVLCSARAAEPAAPPIERGLRVFVAGHSFLVPVATPLAEVTKLAGLPEPQPAKSLIASFARALTIWELPEEKNTARRAMTAGEVDVLCLSTLKQMPDPGLDKFVELALAQPQPPRVVVQQSWLAWDDDPGAASGARPTDWNAATSETLLKKHAKFYKEFEAQIDAINTKAGRPVIFTVPTSRALIALRERIRGGDVPGIAKQSALFTDVIGHPTPVVALLNAYTHFAMIYRRSPVGVPVPSALKDFKAADREPLNRLLQTIAWETVLAHPQSGVTVKPPAR